MRGWGGGGEYCKKGGGGGRGARQYDGKRTDFCAADAEICGGKLAREVDEAVIAAAAMKVGEAEGKNARKSPGELKNVRCVDCDGKVIDVGGMGGVVGVDGGSDDGG